MVNIPLGLLFGIIVGMVVQWIAVALRYDDRWEKVSDRKKRALTASGGVAALVAGLSFLSATPANEINPLLASVTTMYKVWLLQMVAAWGGAVFMDAIAKYSLNREDVKAK